MALKLDERYPGRADPASVDYPQGSFKNRTSPTAKDGTYLEKDWANDQQGFLQSLLKSVGVVANGVVDKVGASQYFDALTQLISDGSPSQATDSIAGIAKIATPAILKAGTNNDSFATAKGLKDAGLWPLGVGQTRQDVTASRSIGTTNTNGTGRTIEASITITVATTATASLEIGGVAGVCRFFNPTSSPMGTTFTASIKDLETYTLTGATIIKWVEIR